MAQMKIFWTALLLNKGTRFLNIGTIGIKVRDIQKGCLLKLMKE
jgi:hypothetical protein